MYKKITQAPMGETTNRWLPLDIDNETHHSMKCISSSQIKYIASGKSMFSYHEKYVLKNVDSEFSDAFRVGTIAHLAVLEPEKFEKNVIVCDLDQRTSEFKEFRSLLAKTCELPSTQNTIETLDYKLKSLEEELALSDTKEQKKVIKEKIKKTEKEILAISKSSQSEPQYTKNGGFIGQRDEEIFLVKSKEMIMYRTFQKRFEEHKWLSAMLPMCTIEQSGVAQDPETGLWMSLRGDARGDTSFIDPKTIDDYLSVDSIQRYLSNYQLVIQAAHYIETANLIEPGRYKNFNFVMMSKKQPYEIAFVRLDKYSMEMGMRWRRQILNKIARCEQADRWPSIDYNDGQHGLVIKLPPWAIKMDEEE